MIKNLNGEYETVEYSGNSFILLYDNNTDENFPTHWHNAIEIIMPLRNDFTVFTGGQKYVLHERDIIIIPPGELHSLIAPPEGQRIIFQCDSSVLTGLIALSSISTVLSKTVCINLDDSEELRNFAKTIMLGIYDEYYSGSELFEIKIYTRLLELLIKIRENQLYTQKNVLKCTPEKLVEYNEKFGVVLKYIDKNYMEDISLDKLASIAGYSKYHFSRIFKQYCEMSYITYINKIRTNAAQQLLLDPNLSITEVAMSVGFSSITSFNRAFKEIKHCTPSEYKKFYKLN